MQTTAQPTAPKLMALGASVTLEGSGEAGTIIGGAVYLNNAPSYLVRYVNGQGCLTTDWWPAEALRLLVPDEPHQAFDSSPLNTPLAMPTLNPDERYAGIVIHPENGRLLHHLILLPNKPRNPLSWHEATIWARLNGYSIPDRQEAYLLKANVFSDLAPEWHWIGEPRTDDQSEAMVMCFNGGGVGPLHKGNKCHVRAIRRVPIA